MMLWYTTGMWRVGIELLEAFIVTGYLLFQWQKETRLTHVSGLLILLAITIDVGLFHSNRPFWVCLILNGLCSGGWFWMYEKLRIPLAKAVKRALALLLSLL